MEFNPRSELFNKIVMMLMSYNIDILEIKDRLYIILDEYEIGTRCTEVALLEEDRNEYLIKMFITSKIVKGCSQRTLKTYKNYLYFILQKICKTADDITADDIRIYLAKRMNVDGISKVSADNELRVLRSFFSYLTAEEIVIKNPLLKVDSIKADRIKKEAFKPLEVEKLRDATENNREKAVVEILLSTGCRVSELVGIKKSEIQDDGRIIVHGKGNKDRYVYLNAKAILALEKYLGERKDDNPYVFPASSVNNFSEKTVALKQLKKAGKLWYQYPICVSDDKSQDPGAIEQMIRKIAKRAGVEKAHPHKFRRTCATFALRRGMPVEQVSKMLGHEDLKTTQIYLDISDEDMQASHKKYVV